MRTKIFILFILFTLSISFSTKNNTHADFPYLRNIPSSKSIKIGKASWYSEESPGINERTANNEIFDDSRLTAAMWQVPFNQRVRVTNLKNGKSVTVRINDRGPHKRYVKKGRIIDLSKYAFSNIAPLKEGLIHIQLELL